MLRSKIDQTGHKSGNTTDFLNIGIEYNIINNKRATNMKQSNSKLLYKRAQLEYKYKRHLGDVGAHKLNVVTKLHLTSKIGVKPLLSFFSQSITGNDGSDMSKQTSPPSTPPKGKIPAPLSPISSPSWSPIPDTTAPTAANANLLDDILKQTGIYNPRGTATAPRHIATWEVTSTMPSFGRSGKDKKSDSNNLMKLSNESRPTLKNKRGKLINCIQVHMVRVSNCLLYTSPSPRDS